MLSILSLTIAILIMILISFNPYRVLLTWSKQDNIYHGYRAYNISELTLLLVPTIWAKDHLQILGNMIMVIILYIMPFIGAKDPNVFKWKLRIAFVGIIWFYYFQLRGILW